MRLVSWVFGPMSIHLYNFENFCTSYISVIVIMPVYWQKKFEHRLKKSATVNVFSVAIEVFVYSYFPYQSHLPLERSRDREVDPRGLCLPVAFMCPKKLKKPIKRKKKFCLQLSHFGYFRKSSKVNF